MTKTHSITAFEWRRGVLGVIREEKRGLQVESAELVRIRLDYSNNGQVIIHPRSLISRERDTLSLMFCSWSHKSSILSVKCGPFAENRLIWCGETKWRLYKPWTNLDIVHIYIVKYGTVMTNKSPKSTFQCGDAGFHRVLFIVKFKQII